MDLNKYHNKKVTVDGKTFDSTKEMKRYLELKLLERVGVIEDLKLQVPFELIPNFKHNGKTVRGIKYIADFVYFDNEKQKMIIEDTKGYRTEVYRLKKKLMEYNGFDITEI